MHTSQKKEPPKFSLGCEVFQKDIDFNEKGKPGYIDQKKFKTMAQDAQWRLVELDALRNGYQQIIDAYEDLCPRYHGNQWYYGFNPMRLGDLQA